MPRKLFLLLAILLIIGAVALFIRGQVTRVAQFTVESQPQSTVFIDGEQMGVTPFKTQHKAGEIRVKLVPFSQENGLVPYETKVTLVPGVETVLRRSFGPTDQASSGELLSFERMGGRAASLALVSSPDAAEIELDGKKIGFSPHKLDALEVGEHTIRVNSPGYSSRELSVRTVSGYRLTVVVKLAKLQEEAQAPEALEKIKTVLVEITTTPTGFLRVRTEPSTSATESARVTPGKRYRFIEENSEKTWYKIEYEQSKSGWVSTQYAKKVEE